MIPVLFISFVVCLAVGVPVAFSLGVSSCLYFVGSGMPINTFAQKFFNGMDSFTLLCIPGFTFAGNLMNQGGISDKLLDFAEHAVGHLRGGLAYANVLASMVFAGLSGTALADTVSHRGDHDRSFCLQDVHGRHRPRPHDGRRYVLCLLV